MDVYRNDAPLALLHELALRLAPELKDCGLRLLRYVEAFGPVGKSTNAYAMGGRPLGIRDKLRRRGEWPGYWGSYIVFVSRPSEGLLIHEIAHRLPGAALISDAGFEPSEAQVKFQQAVLSDWASGEWHVEPWARHEADWIRRVMHLQFRASYMGLDVPLKAITVAGENYGLSMPSNYQYELNTEPQRFRLKSFAEIEAEPMPSSFVKLFERDVREYQQQISEVSKA